jgi:hypothetical protein
VIEQLVPLAIRELSSLSRLTEQLIERFICHARGGRVSVSGRRLLERATAVDL